MSYRLIQEQAIEKGLIMYRDIANSFRKEISIMRFGIGRSPIAKGAFGPSFAGQDDSGQGANSRDAQNSTEGASQRSRRRHTKRARAPDEDNSPSTVTRSCRACGLPHLLSNCYYVFPEKAPPRFTKNPELWSVVDKALEADLALQEEV